VGSTPRGADQREAPNGRGDVTATEEGLRGLRGRWLEAVLPRSLDGHFERAFELCVSRRESLFEAALDLLAACVLAYGWFWDFQEHAPDERFFGG
jgi:hypothetical protein